MSAGRQRFLVGPAMVDSLWRELATWALPGGGIMEEQSTADDLSVDETNDDLDVDLLAVKNEDSKPRPYIEQD
jgi:hypothetical protein